MYFIYRNARLVALEKYKKKMFDYKYTNDGKYRHEYMEDKIMALRVITNG